MHGADGLVHVVLAGDDRDADFGGRDELDVHPGVGQRGEEVGGDARIALHAGADQRDLADLVVVAQRVEADAGPALLQRVDGLAALGLRQGEGDVRQAGGGRGHVLHDHVDVDLGVCDRAEDRGRLARLVRHTDDRDLGLRGVVRDTGDEGLLHLLFPLLDRLAADPRALESTEAGPDVDRDVVPAGVLHTAVEQHLGAGGRELQHVLEGDPVDLLRLLHHARVGGEHAVDVGVDLTDVRVERGGEGDGRGVGPAPAQRGDVLAVLADALEAGHDGDVALVHRGADASRRHVDDPGLVVDRVGDDSGLAAGERLGLVTQVFDRHGQQRHGDTLPGGQQHVEFAPGRDRGYLLGEIDQLVRRVAHRGNDGDHLVAVLLRFHDPLGDALDALGIGYGGASVLLHDKAHVRSSLSPSLSARTYMYCGRLILPSVRIPPLRYRMMRPGYSLRLAHAQADAGHSGKCGESHVHKARCAV
ncbi:putative Integrase [Streptomyces ambofaciens ATCC 23877]|uniref:Putative Integrase n=1 Tax=Streptomyces ambofaciens (strain ATCC 23877 / 3486 / DSM 40053 / JCM 4204 / NBRC 12836 / NRRL B-2516) TaxID=278992 RepID=A0A0K2AVQ4_STRA7|nr:putative Integrase [Streptomyces ambofaciens ATCC 23877]